MQNKYEYESESESEREYELLAPAGNMDGLKAAINAGADAVYLGGHRYNARINAENFGHDQLCEALRYAHIRNVKIYITMNTLLTDNELSEALQYARFLYEEGADALILQDMGLASLIHQTLPHMPLHLSTQATVYNGQGAKAAKDMGFSRVVLARELSLTEIKEITMLGSIETEVFIHGALCICYSGQCQMSRHIGGRSGNRGECAQPCRLPYTGSFGQKGHLLSPKDYWSVESLGQLLPTGVSSLKIEGRMKSPEYIAIVTSLYRKYLDMVLTQSQYTVSTEDKAALAQVFNRGGFTKGYLHGNPSKALMSTEMPKHQGLFIGKVQKICGSGIFEMALAPGAQIALGDSIEVRAKEPSATLVTYLQNKGEGIVQLGDLKKPIAMGDAVYKTVDKGLMNEAKGFYQPQRREEGVRIKRIPIDLSFEARLNGFPQLTLQEKGTDPLVVQNKDCQAQRAIHKPITAEMIENQLKKTGDYPFTIGEIHVKVDPNVSLPLSALNQLRRNAFEAFQNQKVQAKRRKKGEEQRAFIAATEPIHQSEPKPLISLFFYNTQHFSAKIVRTIKAKLADAGIEYTQIKTFIPLRGFMDLIHQSEEGVAPYILNVSKGKEDRYIKANFDKIVDRCRTAGISIGNIAWIRQFAEKGVPVYGDYGLNITNKEAKKAFLAAGVFSVACSSLETGYCFGRIPLMTSEHLFEDEYLIDRKGKKYFILESDFQDKSIILSDQIEWNSQKMKDLLARGESIRIFCDAL